VDLEPLRATLAELEDRVSELERPPRQPAVEEESKSDEPEESPVQAAALRAPTTDEERAFDEILFEMVRSDDSPSAEAMQRFLSIAKGTSLLADRLSAAESRVARNPGDLEARMELADLYVAKLFTTPGGPEQWIFGQKAEDQWRAVTEADPKHWRASFALGNNYAYYPDVMGKTGEAIRYLEQARAIQASAAPVEEHVRTYLALARMYQRTGKNDKAREVLEEGLSAHPAHAELAEALAALGD
jgi:tetratricopeptide (TPR) repeat protein